MASIDFVARETIIPSVWLNAVDAVVHDIFEGTSTKVAARAALELGVTDDVTFAGFTSTGIDDNATVTAITIDSIGDVAFGANVNLVDNKHLYLGASNDLDLYHTGVTSYLLNAAGNFQIDEAVNSGEIKIRTNDSVGNIKNGIIIGGATPYVRLYYDGGEEASTGSSYLRATNGLSVNAPYIAGNTAMITGDASDTLLLNILTTTGSSCASFLNVTVGGGENSADTCMKVRKDTTTSRSINAAGTINASGADYAEYEFKNSECGDIEKGDLIGFDVDGKLTDKFNESISFGVKSTSPCIVGGDSWAEDERELVDRIAYSGKVPVNMYEANVGDYIIPENDNGRIIALSVEAPTQEQYMKSVGRVRKILNDGRPEIAVITH